MKIGIIINMDMQYEKLFKFFAKQPTLALLFSFGIIVLGASSLMNIK